MESALPPPNHLSTTGKPPWLPKTKIRRNPEKVARPARCAPCRMRRVKCERIPGNRDCLKCIKKGIQCVAASTKTNLDGMVTVANDKTPSTVLWKARDILVPAESHLVMGEEQAAVVISLLEIALEQNIDQNWLCLNTTFKKEFKETKGRLHEMSPENQVFCTLVAANSARIANHPICVGQNAPKEKDMLHLSLHTDLSQFGVLRDTLCRQLEDKAIQLADRNGVLRIPSRTNILSLYLLHRFQTWDTPFIPYAWALISQVREMIDCEDREKDLGQLPVFSTNIFLSLGIRDSPIAWLAYFQDSLYAFLRGERPILEEDEVTRIRAANSSFMSLPSNPTPQFFNFLDKISSVLREGSRMLTSARARRSPRINETFVSQFIANFELLFLTFDQETLFESHQGENKYRDLLTFFRTIRTAACTSLRIFALCLEARAEECKLAIQCAPFTNLEHMQDQIAYQTRLNGYQIKTKMLLFASTRQIAKMCGDILASQSLFSSCGLIVGNPKDFFTDIPKWLNLFINTPPTELNGPPDFSFNSKLQELKWIQMALKQISWSYPCPNEGMEWLSNMVETLESQFAAYNANSTSQSLVSSYPNSTLPPLDLYAYPQTTNMLPSDDPSFYY